MTPGPAAWGAAAVLWVVIGMVPGFLAATALTPATSVLHRWAVSPLVSVGVAFASASWVDRVRPGSGLAAAGVALVLTAVVSIIVSRRCGSRIRVMPRRWDREHTVLAAAVAASVLIDVVVLSRAASAWGTVVPNWDGSAHGRLTERILATGSIDPSAVTSPDLTSMTGGGYYPLGLHTVAALISSVTGVQVGLTAVAFVAASLWAPLGIAAWGRLIARRTEAVAAAVVLAVATPWLLWAPAYWGFWPMVVAVALVPACCASLTPLKSWPGALLGLLAVCGLASVHPPEVLVVALVVGATALLDDAPWRNRLRAAAWVVLASALAGVLTTPRPSGVTGASWAAFTNESVYSWPVALGEIIIRPATGRVPDGISLWATVISVVWWALLVWGSVRLLRRPLARGTVAVIALLPVAALLSFLDVADRLTSPWYSSGYRFLTQLVALGALPIGIAVVALLTAARAPGPLRGLARTALPVAGLTALVIVVQTVRTGDQSLAASVVTEHDRAAYAWLRVHTDMGEQVLNQPRDGSTWLYAETDGQVLPLVAEGRGRRYDSTPGVADKELLTARVADYASDPAVRSAAARWHVRYVLVGEGAFLGSAPGLDAATLATAPGVREVFRSGDAVVYELVG